MALSFPSDIRQPSYELTPEWDRPILESPFEDGSVQTRLKYPRGRDSYTIPWNTLRQAELNSLETFYKVTTSYGALPFTMSFKLPTGIKTITCRFSEAPSTVYKSHDNWQVSIKVKEV